MPHKLSRAVLAAVLVGLPAAALASQIKVTTDPAGATVQLDGVAQGQAPVTIPKVGRGSHTLKVSAEGYVTREDVIDVDGESDFQIHAPLNPAPKVHVEPPRPPEPKREPPALVPPPPPPEAKPQMPLPLPCTPSRGSTRNSPSAAVGRSAKPPSKTALPSFRLLWVRGGSCFSARRSPSARNPTAHSNSCSTASSTPA